MASPDCMVMTLSHARQGAGANGKLRMGAIQLQGKATVGAAAESRRKQSQRPKTLDELRAALVCMDASMSAILSRLTAGAGVEKLERSDLGDVVRHHLTRWVRGDISGRYCFLLLETELTAKPGSTQNKNREAASLASGVMDMLGAMVGLTGDASWQWSGSWLYAEVFSQPPATILKQAVEALVAVAQDELEELESTPLSPGAPPASPSVRPRSQLVADEINLAFRRLAMRAVPLEESSGSEPTSAQGPAETGPASGQEYLRTQIWKELFHIHANGEDERDTPLITPAEAREDPLERDDTWLHTLLTRPTGSVQEESEASTTDELKRANAQLSGYIKGAMALKTKLTKQVAWLEHMSAYAMLGVPKDASNAELKRAYREMAIKVHPDKGGDADQFQELQRAYESIVEERKITGDPGAGRSKAEGKEKKKKQKTGENKENEEEENNEEEEEEREGEGKRKEEQKEERRLKTAAEIMAEDGDEEVDGDSDLDFMMRQVSTLAARAREDADKSGASAQQMLVALKALEGGPADLEHTELTAKECLELSAVGSGHSESAGTNALAVAQKALGIKGPLQGELTKTEAGSVLASAATKAADVGVHSVERSLAALKTYNEMSATQRTAELRMQSWRVRGVVDAEMEQICCELHRATLKTINQVIKECAKAAIDAAVAACEVSRLLSAAVRAVRAAQAEREEAAREEAIKRRREEDERKQRQADGDDEPTEEERKEQERKKEEEAKEKEEEAKKEDEPLPSDPTELEKKLHVMLRVKNTLLLKEVNGNILKLQMEMQRLLQTRMFSMDQAVVSPEQKENLFSTVAELFDQSCSSLELSLNETAGDRAAETPQWWEEALEGALGWVTTAVTTVEVAVPSPRAQILRLAAIVDAAALTFMAEKELFDNARIVIARVGRANGHTATLDAAAAARLETRVREVVQGIEVLAGGTEQEQVPN